MGGRRRRRGWKVPAIEAVSILPHTPRLPQGQVRHAEGEGERREERFREGGRTVSYTHLTLPTICSV
eukprot:3658603-Rhodomonas_salina.1